MQRSINIFILPTLHQIHPILFLKRFSSLLLGPLVFSALHLGASQKQFRSHNLNLGLDQHFPSLRFIFEPAIWNKELSLNIWLALAQHLF
jgi:hypothetical protein